MTSDTIIHWDGRAWSTAYHSATLTEVGFYAVIQGSAADDVWANLGDAPGGLLLDRSHFAQVDQHSRVATNRLPELLFEVQQGQVVERTLHSQDRAVLALADDHAQVAGVAFARPAKGTPLGDLDRDRDDRDGRHEGRDRDVPVAEVGENRSEGR